MKFKLGEYVNVRDHGLQKVVEIKENEEFCVCVKISERSFYHIECFDKDGNNKKGVRMLSNDNEYKVQEYGFNVYSGLYNKRN
jgi:hypothetical protein